MLRFAASTLVGWPESAFSYISMSWHAFAFWTVSSSSGTNTVLPRSTFDSCYFLSERKPPPAASWAFGLTLVYMKKGSQLYSLKLK